LLLQLGNRFRKVGEIRLFFLIKPSTRFEVFLKLQAGKDCDHVEVVITWKDHPSLHERTGSMADFKRSPQTPKQMTPTEQALLTSEELFRHAFDFAAVGMAFASPDGRLLKVNEALCHILGFKEEELINLHLQEITYPDDYKEEVKLARQTLEGKGRNFQFEKRCIHKNGSLVWVLFSSSLVRDADDNPNYFVMQMQDITDRKLAEKKLLESKLKYQSLIKHNPDIICMLDETGILMSSNPATVQITGYSFEELAGKSFLPFIDVMDWKKTWELFTKAKYGEIRSAEIQMLHKKGYLIELEISYVPIITNNELTGIYLIAKDISERKQNEVTIERLHNKNKMILSAVSEGIFGIDDELGTIFWNAAAEKITGYSYKEIMGKNVYDILRPSNSEGTPYKKGESPISSSLLEGVYFHVANEEFHKKTGEAFPVEYMTNPIYEEGKIIGAVVTFKDITERRRTEEHLLKSEKLSIVGQIAAGVAHEIRNPLTTLKGFTQLMQSGVPNKQEYYDIMLSELNRIELIITEMLVLAKPHMNRFQPRDFSMILNHVVALLEAEANLNDIQFVLIIEQNLPMILCEENQLKQMLIHLLKNAMEAMSENGQINIRLQAEGSEHISMTIKDQGCGMPPEVLERLGEPFFTTKDKGTGLGVTISYKIIEDHKGSMQIESRVGEGTVVHIVLPVTGN
jgi:PAS domain S-box-containing protein